MILKIFTSKKIAKNGRLLFKLLLIFCENLIVRLFFLKKNANIFAKNGRKSPKIGSSTLKVILITFPAEHVQPNGLA
jgi:hypothetical protein